MPTITDLGYNPKTKTKRNQSLSSMKRRIEYIYNKSTLIDSVLVNIDSVEVIYNEFIQTKKEFNKLDGNNFFHYVISFSDEDKIDEKDVMEIVYKFLEDKKFDGFQIFYGTHQDTDNLHCHILINSVNCINGKKWHLDNRKKDWLDMELKLNKIAKPYGCKIPEKIARLMEEKEVKNEYARKSKDEKSKYEEKMNMTGKSWKVKVKETIE
ncbi:relaxase/mobilization nuclease domain-containing protein, partial [Peptoanaerobacter stomatis]